MKHTFKFVISVPTNHVVFFHITPHFYRDLFLPTEDLEEVTSPPNFDIPDGFFVYPNCLSYTYNKKTAKLEFNPVEGELYEFLTLRHRQCLALDYINMFLHISRRLTTSRLPEQSTIILLKEQEAKEYLAGTNLTPAFLSAELHNIRTTITDTITLYDVAKLALLKAEEFRKILLITDIQFQRWNNEIKQSKTVTQITHVYKQILAELHFPWK